MKLRRSLALAAATAAITPAVLLTAPIAYADEEGPTSAVTETAPSVDESTPAADDTTPSTDDTTPAGQESTPAADDSTPAAAGSSPAASGSASPSAVTSPSASASVSASPSPSGFPTECADSDEPKFDKELHTSLSGLPSKIVAGSGFHGFTLNVNNTGDHAYQRVDLGVFATQVNEDDFFDDTSHLTLQFKDPSSGTWENISLDENDEGAGYVGYTEVKAHESFSIDMRLSVDKSAPAGLGYAVSIGMYADDEGNCVYSGDDSFYEFDILKAGSTPGDPGDAKPQGGKKPLPKKQPTGNNKIEPQGHLAETGSDSALPLIGLAGGAAVAVGAGAVFVVRRRKSAGGGAAV
ncbi:LAETG motif-containing sortase-dependent surface protein [Streptomyces sp. NPDC052301]|uniref:LAETG motif-containing sortase-dependent surface protein n=1 Tax=Streptomyces sp. NPDC052301 TaxID=3365687 RepID=UPI0037D49FA5